MFCVSIDSLIDFHFQLFQYYLLWFGNPNSKLQTAVTGKVKKGGKLAARRKSYCARSAGQLKKSSAKTRNDPNSRIRQARRRWKC